MQNYFNDTQDVLTTTKRILDRDILANQSTLIENPKFFELNSYSPYEVAENLFKLNDETVHEQWNDTPPDEQAEILEQFDVEKMDDIPTHELAERFMIDHEGQEVMEWWLVSNWLYNHLCGLGFVTLDTEWGYYWGRTTSGQAIELDGVIQDVARLIHNERRKLS